MAALSRVITCSRVITLSLSYHVSAIKESVTTTEASKNISEATRRPMFVIFFTNSVSGARVCSDRDSEFPRTARGTVHCKW